MIDETLRHREAAGEIQVRLVLAMPDPLHGLFSFPATKPMQRTAAESRPCLSFARFFLGSFEGLDALPMAGSKIPPIGALRLLLFKNLKVVLHQLARRSISKPGPGQPGNAWRKGRTRKSRRGDA
jgi:hypothetical protein